MKNELLEQVKEQYADSRGFNTWEEIKQHIQDAPETYSVDSFEYIMDKITVVYAKEFAKAELEKVKAEILESAHEIPKGFWSRSYLKGVDYALDLVNKRTEEL